VKQYPDEAAWVEQQRLRVVEYMSQQPVKHGGVASTPDWYLSPYLSIWRIESGRKPGVIGWWAIAGDCPTDYLSGKDATDARGAMRAFAKIWTEAATLMKEGKEHPALILGTPENRVKLGDLLHRRASLISDFANDDDIW
jgi:hypothetical protein